MDKLKAVIDLTFEELKEIVYIFTGTICYTQDDRDLYVKDIKEVECGGYDMRRRIEFLFEDGDEQFLENSIEIDSCYRNRTWVFRAEQYYNDKKTTMSPYDIVELVDHCKINNIDVENRLRSDKDRIEELNNRNKQLQNKFRQQKIKNILKEI